MKRRSFLAAESAAGPLLAGRSAGRSVRRAVPDQTTAWGASA